MGSNLETGFELDRRFHWLRGEMEQSKKPALVLLGRLLAEERVEHAIIGGIALQVRQQEPRTTLDIGLAVADADAIPRERLRAEGFSLEGTHPWSENWRGPGSVPVQFTADPAFAEAVRRAEVIRLDDVELRVLRADDLVRAKLRAAADPASRRSKRLQDLADVQALLEADASLASALTEEERARLRALLP